MELIPGKPLSANALYTRCDAAALGFDSTAELEDLVEIPGQDRALEAIRFATEIDVDGHNVYVLGPPGSGRHVFVRRFLEQKAAQRPVPQDWCYVYNFDDPRQPRALALPSGLSGNPSPRSSRMPRSRRSRKSKKKPRPRTLG
jgi:hypothetical protein